VSPLLLITPTIPNQDLPMLLPFLSSNWQQPQRQVPWMLTPEVLMPLLSNGAGRLNQQWG